MENGFDFTFTEAQFILWIVVSWILRILRKMVYVKFESAYQN